MKKLILLFALISPLLGVSQRTYTAKNGDVHLLGSVDINDLRAEPYKEWFEKQIDQNYKLENTETLKDLKVEIFLGTWCGDSRIWIPEFIKLWTDNGLSLENLSFIALHNEDEQYKRSPMGEEKGLNIHRVPTFIFYDKNEEVGRIVESPINNLKTDVLQIAMGIPSNPRYRAVSLLEEAMNTQSIDSLYTKSNYRPLLQKIYGEVSKPSELNTYGYVLSARGDTKKAEFVFYINRNLFKFDPNTWDSLGEIYLDQNKLEEAKLNYEKVLELNPDSKNAIKQLEIIAEKIK